MSEADQSKAGVEHPAGSQGLKKRTERDAYIPARIAGGTVQGERDRPSWTGMLDELYAGGEPEMPTDEEIDRLIRELEGQFDSNQAAELLATCKDTVLQSIIGPFGLGRVLAERDRSGGRVLTRHNAKAYRKGDKDIFVPDGDRYDQKDYKHDSEVRKQKLDENRLPGGQVKDDYTGQPTEKPHVDHVVSKEQFHYDEGGYMSSKEARKDFANDTDNLAVTDQSINQSKGSKSVSEAKQEREHKAAAIDGRRSGPIERRAEKVVSRRRPSATDAARYYARKVAPEAAATGIRLGVRQALGLCLNELTVGIFREVTDICRNGLREGETSYSDAVWKRAGAVLRGLQAKWRDMLATFKDGFVAGVLSEVATLLVNLFQTTSKRVVRIIREGFVSFLKAIAMVVSVPEGMTRYEALDAAVKLMATAVLAACGIALEEVIERALQGWPLADLIVPVVLGILVGLATAAVVFLLDQLDIFGVQDTRRRGFVFAELDARVEKEIAAAESAVREPLRWG